MAKINKLNYGYNTHLLPRDQPSAGTDKVNSTKLILKTLIVWMKEPHIIKTALYNEILLYDIESVY